MSGRNRAIEDRVIRIRFQTVALIALLSATVELASGQLVRTGPSDPHYCEHDEKIEPNLVLQKDTHVYGSLKDQSGAPFNNKTKVELRRFVTEEKQPTILIVTTDAEGKYDLGRVKPGKYRLLLSATRGFKQAEKLKCYAQDECELSVVLEVNPTDMPGAGCPVR